MVIQARSAQAPIIQLEAQGGDEVERRPVMAQSRITFPVFGGISGS